MISRLHEGIDARRGSQSESPMLNSGRCVVPNFVMVTPKGFQASVETISAVRATSKSAGWTKAGGLTRGIVTSSTTIELSQ